MTACYGTPVTTKQGFIHCDMLAFNFVVLLRLTVKQLKCHEMPDSHIVRQIIKH